MMRKLLLMLLAAVGMNASAVSDPEILEAAVEVDEVRYLLDKENGNIAKLVAIPHSRSVVLPEYIEYEGVTYTVEETVKDFLLSNSFVKEVTLPRTLKKIGAGSLRTVTKITSLVIPGSVSEIPTFSLRALPAMESLILEDGVESIGAGAVSIITGTVHIPSSVKSFEMWSMDRVDDIDYDFRNAVSIGGSSFGKNNIRKLEFSDGVEIGVNSFYKSQVLTDLVLPREFYVEKGGAFPDCNVLVSVVVKAEVPPMCMSKSTGETYEGLVINTELPAGCTLYVPKGSANAYRNSPSWANFKNIKEIDMAGVSAVVTEEDAGVFEAWNLAGMAVGRGANRAEALAGLPAGIYILRHNGLAEKVAVK